MRKALTKFCKLVWTNMYNESLWNYVIQQGVFNRFKITYCKASSMNNSGNSDIPDFSDLQFLEKKKCKKSFTNCEKTNCEGLIWTLSRLFHIIYLVTDLYSLWYLRNI